MTHATSSSHSNSPTIVPMLTKPTRAWPRPTKPRWSTSRHPPGVATDHATETATEVLVQATRALEPSGAASKKRHSHRASGHPPTSPSTFGKQTPLYGWKIFDSPAKLEGQMMTTSSSSTSPSALGSMFEHGSNSCCPTASAVGRSSSSSLSKTYRGRTCARKLLGPQELQAGAWRVPAGLHSQVLQAVQLFA
jgi:hypothetical protein